MAFHAPKRRKIGHRIDRKHSIRSNLEGGPAHDMKHVVPDDEALATSSTSPSHVSNGRNTGVLRTHSRDALLLGNQVYNSSLITLQVRDLLEEVRPNYASLMADAEPVLRRLKANIEDFPRRAPLTVRLRIELMCVHPTDLAESAGSGGRKRV